jgi:hypothetical protein
VHRCRIAAPKPPTARDRTNVSFSIRSWAYATRNERLRALSAACPRRPSGSVRNEKVDRAAATAARHSPLDAVDQVALGVQFGAVVPRPHRRISSVESQGGAAGPPHRCRAGRRNRDIASRRAGFVEPVSRMKGGGAGTVRWAVASGGGLIRWRGRAGSFLGLQAAILGLLGGIRLLPVLRILGQTVRELIPSLASISFMVGLAYDAGKGERSRVSARAGPLVHAQKHGQHRCWSRWTSPPHWPSIKWCCRSPR